MALFNKLFSSRKNCLKNQDSVCEKVCLFTKDQVRIVLFRECDFRGRKLLFDSRSVQKVYLSAAVETQAAFQNCAPTATKSEEKYVEISNGYGYQYIKACPDIGQLGEMVFGSVAMSYRGTSLKIHSLTSPARLMCSQIFPSPRQGSRGCSSAPSQSYVRSSNTSSQSLDKSIRLYDSGASSANSISDHLSLHSTSSDTLLVCREYQSVPLDVPTGTLSAVSNNNPTSSVIGDSGCSGEQSYNSISSGPQSLPLCCMVHEGEQSFSCGSLYKRWLRSGSTSLDHSSSPLTGSASADECLLKPHTRSSKLGLAVIIELPCGQEQLLEQFFMEHAALIESMVWRTRQGAEIAYIRHNSFVSLMFEVATNSIQWLVDLLSGPQLANHMWISVAPVCDKLNSIHTGDNVKNANEKCNNFSYSNCSCASGNQSDASRTVSLNDLEGNRSNITAKLFANSSSSASLNNSVWSDITNSFDSSDTLDKSSDFTILNLTRFLRNEWAMVSTKNSYSCSDKNIMAEKCVTELCELLECVDIKQTNFFVSTLVTAVLTYHLGWVTSVLPPTSSDKERVSTLHNPCNPLWGQLTDLYGAIGHPTKVAHTIVTGTNKAELISKILNSLTYFIRCSDMNRKCVSRVDMKEENKRVDCICHQKSCIPKENFKTYEDHLREMELSNTEFLTKQLDVKKTNTLSSTFKNNETAVTSINYRENIEMCNLSDLQNTSKENPVVTKTKDVSVVKEAASGLKGRKKSGLFKAQTCLTNLNNLEGEDTLCNRLYPNLDHLSIVAETDVNNKSNTLQPHNISNKVQLSEHSQKLSNTSSPKLLNKVKKLGIQAVYSPAPDKTKELELTNTVINEKVRKLCRVPASAVLYHMEPTNTEEQQLVDIQEASEQIMKIFAPKKINMEKQMSSIDCKFKTDQLSKTKGLTKTTSNFFAKSADATKTEETNLESKNVIFVLGDDEKLIGLKKDNVSNLENIPTTKLSTLDSQNCNFRTSKKLKNNNSHSVPDVLKITDKCDKLKFLNSDSSTSEKLEHNKCYDLETNSSKSVLFETTQALDKESNFFENSKFKDSDFAKYQNVDNIKPSASWTSLELLKTAITSNSSSLLLESECVPILEDTPKVQNWNQKEFNRSKSVPPENKNTAETPTEVKSKYRYSGVKFNFQQYPQIVTNYMRSKNLELSQLTFADKTMKLSTLTDYPEFDFLNCDTQLEEVEILQTPSNASELEFTSDLVSENYEIQHAKEKLEPKPKTFVRNHLSNTIIKEPTAGSNGSCPSYVKKTLVMEHPLQITDRSNNAMFEHEESNSSEEDYFICMKLQPSKMQLIELPMPRSEPVQLDNKPINYTSSLLRGIGDRYISDMVLQGTCAPKCEWEPALRRDLSLATRHPLLDQTVDEAIAVVANTDTWEVQLLSSHTYVVDRGSTGVRVGMSQLVANMLESLLHMWKLHTPPEYCIMHIEQRLQEFCTLSKALAELLLATEFCSMDLLTSVLQLEVNDVPLLMAVASTHSPQVTQKYGLTFQ